MPTHPLKGLRRREQAPEYETATVSSTANPGRRWVVSTSRTSLGPGSPEQAAHVVDGAAAGALAFTNGRKISEGIFIRQLLTATVAR
jgi:hypothetical protein